MGHNVSSAPMEPEEIDPNVRFTSVGGLKEHKRCLREMIIFPLMYPELFKKFNTRPAKGVLFYGPPGTGKTLLARALANECSSVDGRKVSFFMRKGADVTNMFYGESERKLRELFKMARRMKPSIIFFDEIDALAPTRRNDVGQCHASVVATLLAEMDGISDRGNVIVIGATNRPEAMDPAVRRAGRFDRELYFPPPDIDAKREILHIYTKDWDPELSDVVLDQIAEKAVGFLGSDLKALCSEAVLKAIRRVYPQIYESEFKLLINEQNVKITQEDLMSAMEEITPTIVRYAPSSAKPLPPHTLPLLQAQVQAASVLLKKTFPPPPTDKKFDNKNESSTTPSVFLVSGECAETWIAPALLAQLEHCYIKELNVLTLYAAQYGTPENSLISLFSECRGKSNKSCIIFIRDLLAVWTALEKRGGGGEVLLQMWRRGSVDENILLLAAWDGDHKLLPRKLQEIFPVYKDCIYKVRKPTPIEVTEFLTPIFTELPLIPPMVYTYEPPPPLPRAPIGPKNEENAVQRLLDSANLRVLRGKLKSIYNRLFVELRYRKFASYIYYDDCEDYYQVIKQPMNLNKILNKINRKKYYCAKEFLDDIDLICSNALLYQKVNPAKRCQDDAECLHSDAHRMVVEKISDKLELECQLIANNRRERDDSSDDGSVHSYKSEDGPNNTKHSRTDNKRRRKGNKGPPPKKRKHDHPSDRSGKNSKGEKRPKDTRPENTKDNSKNNKKENRLYHFVYNIADDDLSEPDSESEYIEQKSTRPNQFGDTTDNFKNSKKENRPNQSLHIADEDFSEPNREPEKNEQKSIEIPEVIINKTELEDLVRKYSDPLSALSLETLIDLHNQLSKTVYLYSLALDRTKLPKDMDTVITRYLSCKCEDGLQTYT